MKFILLFLFCMIEKRLKFVPISVFSLVTPTLEKVMCCESQNYTNVQKSIIHINFFIELLVHNSGDLAIANTLEFIWNVLFLTGAT